MTVPLLVWCAPITISGSGGVGGALRIVTKGGAGMGMGGLRQFLQWGKRPDEVGLNRYGQGGKAAIGYLSQGVRIRSNHHADDTAYQLEDHDWLTRPDGALKRFIPQTVSLAVPGQGVVQIELLNLRRAINLKRLERELAGKALRLSVTRNGGVAVWVFSSLQVFFPCPGVTPRYLDD